VLVDELPPVVLTVLPESTRQRVAHGHLSEAETRVELYRLDEMYNEMKFSFVSKFDNYITVHPGEFVHPVE
jgi:hypothetical protein